MDEYHNVNQTRTKLNLYFIGIKSLLHFFIIEAVRVTYYTILLLSYFIYTTIGLVKLNVRFFSPHILSRFYDNFSVHEIRVSCVISKSRILNNDYS